MKQKRERVTAIAFEWVKKLRGKDWYKLWRATVKEGRYRLKANRLA